MKTTIAWAGLLVWSATAFAQEQDDMYFNKKDRAKLQKAKATEEVLVRAGEPIRFDYAVNKNTAAISSGAAYETNPEFIARSQSEMVSGEEDAYFIENYQYATQNQFSQYSNNVNNWNNSPLYSNNWFAPNIYGWNSPYYSPYNDPFLTGFNANPWCNSAFRSGWSVSFNFGWGNAWNYWGPSAYWGYYWGDPFWNFGGSYAWGRPGWNSWGWNNWYYPSTVIIVDNDNYRGPVYGKRGSRSQSVANNITSSRSGSRSTAVRSSSDAENSNFRQTSTRTRSTASQEYYTPQWRRTQSGSGNSSVGSGRSSGTTFDRSSAPSRSSSGFSAPAQQRSSGSYNSSPSRSSGSFSSPSRSSGGSSGGSRSSSSRGRGN